MVQQSPRPLPQGVYVPTVTFFKNENEVDITTTKKHAVRLAKAGVAGIAVQGSNGEAVHLDSEERKAITTATRSALDENGFSQVPVIVGCGAQSTRETLRLCRDAADAGGDYVLILPPSYYRSLMTRDTVLRFYSEVAEASPLPVVIYNFPGAVAGIDLDSDDVIELGKLDKIVGIKLTCGNTGKLARIASALELQANSRTQKFSTFGGSADFTLQTFIAGGDGVVGGVGNLIPYSCVKVVDLYKAGKIAEAQELQGVVARADWITIKAGFVGTKAALEEFWGYPSCAPRRPYFKPEGKALEELKKGLKEAVEVERKLAAVNGN